MSQNIIIRGARVHNLKNITTEIPFNALTVITGVSGSGKSSLAFDLLYAEGQRRYIESLSAYARQFLERMEKPEVDEVDGIMPAIAIRQKTASRNPRSTVATTTEIYDFLRLLYARVGTTVCCRCGKAVQRDTVDEIASKILELPFNTRLLILFPLRRKTSPEPSDTRANLSQRRKSAEEREAEQRLLKERLTELRQQGFTRLFQKGRVFEFSTPESLLDIDFNQPVYVLVDRITVDAHLRQRLIDSIELCFRQSGDVVFEVAQPSDSVSVSSAALPLAAERPPQYKATATTRFQFSERFECKACGLTYHEPEPQLFSFNNPFGACPRCQGFGNTIDFDLDLVIPDKRKSINEGAIEPWTKPQYRHLLSELKRIARIKQIPLHTPFQELSEAQKEFILNGDARFPGIKGFFQYLERKKYKLHVRVFLSRYRGYSICPECKGTRLREEARCVQVGGLPITEVTRMTIGQAHAFFHQLRLTSAQATIADRLLHEIRTRLKYLYEVGLEYLTLDRLASTLSGGESQRIQLASALGSSLVGTLYILDEPSIGLHPRDSQKLIRILKNLRDTGNTVVVVEHDAEMIRASDHVIDLGPGAGEWGGQVVFSGALSELLHYSNSVTGKYLSGEMKANVPRPRTTPNGKVLKIIGAHAHNLKSIDVTVPLNMMVCITGVSGSGKSTLVHEVLYQAFRERQGEKAEPAAYKKIEGWQHLNEVILVDQSPIGRTPRSNPVTYLKAFDAIREVFAATRDAQTRGFQAGHFSFNIPGGRCETCQGDGRVTVEMQFLADVELICEECKGMRFKSSVLDVRHKGKNIYDVLQMTVREAIQYFSSVPKIVNRLRVLDEVGLGYIRLGQSATTLSGGEAQRVKLAAHLTLTNCQKTLFIFDEPTTGLHFDDIDKLLRAFARLVQAGASLLIIEHNLDVMKAADWIIDLGPEGGDRGGYVVTAGPPEAVVKNSKSYTGKFLAPRLNHHVARNHRTNNTSRR